MKRWPAPCVTTAIVIFLLFVSGSAASELIPLYLTPDADMKPVIQVEPGDPSLATLVDQGSGWLLVKWTGRYTGFISNDDLGASGKISPGIAIRSEPSEDAPIITHAEPNDEIDTIWSGVWHEVTFTKTIPLFMRARSSPPSEPTAQSEPRATSAAESAPSPTASLAPAPQPASPEPAIPLPVPLQFEGYLERSRPRFPLFRHPFPYQLTAEDGSRIAYVDPRELILPGPLEDFADSWVAILGQTSESRRGRLIIHALQIQSK